MSQNAGVRSIEAIIEGDISGQVAVGNYNLQIGSIHGVVVNVVPPAQRCAPRPRATPIDLRPRRFPDLLDRTEEIRAAEDALASGGPLELHGEDGTGKTTLLRHLAHELDLAGYPDGIVHLRVGRQPVGDLLQSLYDAFYECDVPYRPLPTRLRLHLREKRALILLDDAELKREDAQELLDFLSNCSVFVSGRKRVLLGEGRTIALAGLPTADALALLERELGASLSESDREQAECLCEALSGHPLRIIQLAAVIRDQKRSLSEIAQEVDSSQAFDELIVESVQQLPESERKILGLLAALGDSPLRSDHVAAITGISNAEEVLQQLRESGLARSHSPRYSLQDSLTEALRARWDTSSWVEHGWGFFEERTQHTSPEGLLEDAETIHVLLEEAATARRWQTVVTLGRGLDIALAQGKRWDTWKKVLHACRRATEETEDRSTEAWALHQLGTRSLCLNEADEARSSLTQALRIREALHDEDGAAVTRHNLDLLPGPPGPTRDDSDPSPPDRGTSPPKPPIVGPLGKLAIGLFGAAVVVTGVAFLLHSTGVMDVDRIIDRIIGRKQVNLDSLDVSPNRLMGGETAGARLTLDRPAPDGGFEIDVSIDKPPVAFLNGNGGMARIRIERGDTQADFKVGTRETDGPQDVTVTVSDAGGQMLKQTLRVEPTVKLSSLGITPDSVPGGQTATGKLTLNRPAPRDGFAVTLSLDNSQAASLAAGSERAGQITLELRQDEVEAGFYVATNRSDAPGQVAVTASRGGRPALTAMLRIQPSVRPKSLTLDRQTVSGGDSVGGEVMLASPAPQGGFHVSLKVDDSGAELRSASGQSGSAISLPISQGSLSATFTLHTSLTDVLKTVRVRAVHENDKPLETTLTIRPMIKLAKVDVSPSTLVGGGSATGTVTLNRPADEEATVQLNAEPRVVEFLVNGQQADRVTIPAGERAADFEVKTKEVQKQTQVTVTGRFKDGEPKQGSITLSVGVHVPNVTGMSLPKAYELLKAKKLNLWYDTDPAMTYDRVRSQNPPAHREDRPSIVAEGSGVTVVLERYVPNVTIGNGRTDGSVKEARSWLRQFGLTPSPGQKLLDDDVVTRQNPVAGDYTQPSGNVDLYVQVRVPEVAGHSVEEALKRLSERGLKRKFSPEINLNEPRSAEEKPYVGSQDPEYNQLRERGSTVELRLAVRVPDLIGKTKQDAESLLKRRYLTPNVVNSLARPSDVVRGQLPSSGTAVFLLSPVTLDPITAPVPGVTGLTIGDALAKLKHEDFRARHWPNPGPSAKVTDQKPKRGVHIPRGSAVDLVIEVQVPPVEKLPVEQAVRQLQVAGLGWKLSHRPLRSDLVYNQVPPALAWTRPGTDVRLDLGTMVPPLKGQAPERVGPVVESVGLAPGAVQPRRLEVADPRLHGKRQIVDQRPPPGQLVRRGTPVDVVVEHTVTMIPTPGLIRDTLPLALRKLASSGLQGKPGGPPRQMLTRDPRLNGVVHVYRQVPPPGAPAELGSTVWLWTVQYNYRRDEDETPKRPLNQGIPGPLGSVPRPMQPGGTRLR